MNPDTPDQGDAAFDDFARAAGAALRRPAPDNGLAGVRSTRQHRRITQVAAATGTAAIVFIGGALLLSAKQDDSQRLVTPQNTTVVTSPGPSTSTSTQTPSTSTSAPTTTVELRVDGIGPHAFGEPQSSVEATLTASLGQPEVVDELTPAPVVTCIRWGCSGSTVLHWPRAGLLVAFSDRNSDGGALQDPVLAAWTVTPITSWRPGDIHAFDPTSAGVPDPEVRLVLNNGIGLGSTAAEVRSAFPSTVEGWWNDSSFVPTGFYVPDQSGVTMLDGDLGWNVVAELQSALVADGASLTIDGVAGPDTTAAFNAYRERTGLDNPVAAFEALGITGPSPDAQVVRLSAGDWFWELSCGGLEPFGIPSTC